MPSKAERKKPVLDSGSNAEKKRVPARSVSVANQVIDDIRESLLTGKIQAGDFLGTESTLVQHFGIGRSPMRDALRSLEALGIIEIRAGLGGGVYVAKGNPDLFAEILAIQLKLIGITLDELLYAIWAVEGMAVELAADHATDDDLQKLRDIVENLAELRDKPEDFVSRSMDFHAAMVDASHSRALVAQARMLRHILFKHYSEIINREITEIVFTSLSSIARQMSSHSGAGTRKQLDKHYTTARHYMLDSPTA